MTTPSNPDMFREIFGRCLFEARAGRPSARATILCLGYAATIAIAGCDKPVECPGNCNARIAIAGAR